MLRATSVPLLSNEYTTATVASGSAVALTTATTANITSTSLTAGTYLIWGFADWTLTAATTTIFQVAMSLTSATLSTQAGGGGLGTDPIAILPLILTTNTGTVTADCGPTRLVIAATTTLFLVTQATFSAGTVAAYGTLNAMQLNRFSLPIPRQYVRTHERGAADARRRQQPESTVPGA
jgi:hypothetical protein